LTILPHTLKVYLTELILILYPQDDLPENNFGIGIDELDCPFTEEELGKTI